MNVNSRSPGFCLARPSSISSLRPWARASVCARSLLGLTSFTASRTKRPWVPMTSRRPLRYLPQSQMPGNVEDLPLERIPSDPSAVPDYWSRPGVYGVYDSEQQLQYVAAVRDVREAIATHVRIIADPKKVFATRMITVDNEEDAPLGILAENWVMAHFEYGPGCPPGNSDDEPIWREEDGWKLDVYLDPRTDPTLIDSQIRRVLREHRVVLFMKGTRNEPRCGFSSSTVDILSELLGDNFVCVDCLDEMRNRGLRQAIKDYSEWPTIPQLYVDGEFVGGADIVKTMQENGELQALLKSLATA